MGQEQPHSAASRNVRGAEGLAAPKLSREADPRGSQKDYDQPCISIVRHGKSASALSSLTDSGCVEQTRWK